MCVWGQQLPKWKQWLFLECHNKIKHTDWVTVLISSKRNTKHTQQFNTHRISIFLLWFNHPNHHNPKSRNYNNVSQHTTMTFMLCLWGVCVLMVISTMKWHRVVSAWKNLVPTLWSRRATNAYLHSCCRFHQNNSMKPHGITRLNLQVLATVTSTLDMHITTYTTHCSAHLTLLWWFCCMVTTD